MFSCYVFAPYKQPVGDEIIPKATKLTPTQQQERMEQSWMTLQSKLTNLRGVVEIIEKPEQGAVMILSTQNISAELIKRGLHVIDFGQPTTKETFTEGQRFFYIRATLPASPSNGTAIASVLQEEQRKIEEILKNEFGAEVGPHPYPFIYLIAIRPNASRSYDTLRHERPEL